MKKLVVLLVLFVMGSLLAGCQPLVGTREDRSRRISRIHWLQFSMLVDDLDAFTLNDRSTRLSKYYVQAGR